MVYWTGMVCVTLFVPFTVMVTFDVPVGVVYFTPFTEFVHPVNVMVAPANRQSIEK